MGASQETSLNIVICQDCPDFTMITFENPLIKLTCFKIYFHYFLINNFFFAFVVFPKSEWCSCTEKESTFAGTWWTEDKHQCTTSIPWILRRWPKFYIFYKILHILQKNNLLHIFILILIVILSVPVLKKITIMLLMKMK